MNTVVQLELTEQEVEQLLRLAQQAYEQTASRLSPAEQVAFNRVLGKLHLARAEGMSQSAPTKRPYTRRAAKATKATKTTKTTKTTPATPATKTGRKRGRPVKKTARVAQEPTTTEG